jgi:hypothetical protein
VLSQFSYEYAEYVIACIASLISVKPFAIFLRQRTIAVNTLNAVESAIIPYSSIVGAQWFTEQTGKAR